MFRASGQTCVASSIGAAQVALRDEGAAITAGSNRVLTFGGIAQPAVPAGALLVCDPIDLPVPDFADVVIDVFLPDDTAAAKSAAYTAMADSVDLGPFRTIKE